MGVSDGYYTLPEDSSMAQYRISEQQCAQGEYCVNGSRYPCAAGTYNDGYGRTSPCSSPCPEGRRRV